MVLRTLYNIPGHFVLGCFFILLWYTKNMSTGVFWGNISDNRQKDVAAYYRKLERIDTMDIIKERIGKKHSVKVISSADQKKYI
ncbi:hypothetical protein [Clostridium transplantifaecale]|uniref:hypothetical protein n=1 Tax=Clostridium transplantifaecale TaxID=2479838 RepID=UPI000F635108|nr:hypothetical protein [Clostridium transplantifaecale]